MSEFEITNLFVDGIAARLHLGQPREALLAAWGILADGKKAFLHLAPATKEDTASFKEFFQEIRRRGLPDPLLVVSDGAPGIIRALEERLPRSIRQRCLARKESILQNKVSEDVWPDFKARAAARYHAGASPLARVCCALHAGNIVEIAGEFAALLQLTGTKNAASVAEAARSIKLVTGARNHLYRTRVTWIRRSVGG